MQLFENIVGNDKIKESLQNAVKSNNVSHSYLFVGKAGVGKKLFAKDLAKKVMCLGSNNLVQDNGTQNNGTHDNVAQGNSIANNSVKNEKASLEFDNCDSCIKFDANSNPDFSIIMPDGKSIKIEQIRNLQARIVEKPISSSKKVYIIDDADTMTEESQNCLLKTLEEPPEYAMIILIASNENRMLQTIKSRCVIIRFEDLTDEEISQILHTNDQDIIRLCEGSVAKADAISEKKETFAGLKIIADYLGKNSLIDVLNNSDLLYSSKDDIMTLLDFLNIIFFEKAKENIKYSKAIDIIEKTKKKIMANNNYDMCIDYMLMHIWEELHK